MTEEMLSGGKPEETLGDLGVFLNAMLNTQGDTNSEDLTQAENVYYFSELPQSIAPYSTLEPVIAALTTTGSSRYEVIENAFDNKQLNDFRLYNYLSKGLEDKNTSITKYLSETVIPAIGGIMIPFLLSDFDMKGGKADTARLSLFDKLEYGNVVQLAEKALTKGSAPIQVEAIKILGRDPAHEKTLIAYTGDKKAEIREAALIGLIRMDSAEGKEKMIEILSTDKFAPAIAAAKLCKDKEYIAEILKCLEQYYEKVKTETDTKSKRWERFEEMLACLENKDEDYIFDFYIRLFEDNSIKCYMDQVNKLLRENKNTQAVVETYEKIANTRYDPTGYYVNAKILYTKKKMYDVFSPLYLAGKLYYGWFDKTEVDELWCEAFMKKHDIEKIGSMLEHDISPDMREQLLEYLKLFVTKKKETKDYRFSEAVYLLTLYKQPKGLASAADALYEVIHDKNLSSHGLDYISDNIFEKPETVKKLFIDSGREKYIAQLKERFVDNSKLDWYQKRFKKLIDKF
jgi:hypothetical protein